VITLHRLDGEELDLNVWLVETVRSTPDTIVLLTNGHSLAVRESRQEVRIRIEQAMRRVMGPVRSWAGQGV
jgi:flagellar protein FlbD